MKKLFCLLLSLAMLLSSAALAEDVPVDENAALTREEIELYLNGLGRAALEAEDAVVTPLAQGGAEVRLNETVFEISDETLTESSAIVAAYPGDDQADLRGLFLGSSLEEVLAVYPNNNPRLNGSYYDAALFIDDTLFIAGEKSEVSAGYVLRQGQQAYLVAYEVYSWQPDGVSVSSVTYLLENGYVESIRIAMDDEILEEAEAREKIQEIREMQEISEYFAYPVSMDNGEALAPFEREDLALRANASDVLDFLDLTAEGLTDVLGPAPVDEWTEDSDGSFLRLLQWEGVSVYLRYNAQRQFTGVGSLTVNDVNLDGPRGVRVSDSLDSVIYRFRHAEILYADDTVLLYGDGQTVPYGALVYTPENAEVTYALSVGEGRTVVWHMTFVIGELQSMTLALQ
ncbi:MAG: hypothetical protein IJQ62_07055 [Clostridia bacterium]|nr:hypothetical protein [Clostridia bacterium]